MTWIKICGITNLEDALTAVEAGADAVGFVFYEKSPRYVDLDTARAIAHKMPADVEKVGVFVNQFENSIYQSADFVGLTAVQLHGDNEDPHVADLVVRQRPQLKVLVAVSMLHPVPEGWTMMYDPDSVHAFLLDSGGPSQRGGTGTRFDWTAAQPTAEVMARLSRVIVAGGLSSQNVAEAMNILHPWGVDVSSGVEEKPGKKDPDKVRAFVKAVRQADKN